MKHIKKFWLEIVMAFDSYRAARACGLNVMTSIYVAHGDMSLAEALGDMDADAEAAFMELMGIDLMIDGEIVKSGFDRVEIDLNNNRVNLVNPRTVVTGAACQCVGEQACDDCIPF